MLTPNGRFKVATRLCLSMSDFHPETWNPMVRRVSVCMSDYSYSCCWHSCIHVHLYLIIHSSILIHQSDLLFLLL